MQRRASQSTNLTTPNRQVLEFESLGVRVRNTKRFFVLNPTSISYEFVWAPVARAAAGQGSGGADTQSPLVCSTRKGIIGGGRWAITLSI
jgi:hydrocephalus-inducing protein